MRVRTAIVLFAPVLLPSVVHAEACIALLIGNEDFDPSVGILENPQGVISCAL
jgi:hypothetical protein